METVSQEQYLPDLSNFYSSKKKVVFRFFTQTGYTLARCLAGSELQVLEEIKKKKKRLLKVGNIEWCYISCAFLANGEARLRDVRTNTPHPKQ